MLEKHYKLNPEKLFSALKESQSKLDILFRKSHIVMLLVDSETGAIVDANLAASNFYGYTIGQLINKKIQDLDVAPSRNTVEGEMVQHGQHQSASGQIYDIELYRSPVVLEGKVFNFFIVRDISDCKKNQAELFRLSYIDPMTQVYNRTFFDQEIDRLQHNHESSVGVLIFRIDGLKTVNKEYGYSTGDKILANLITEIKGCLPENAIITRFDGSEFAVFISDITHYKMQLLAMAIKKKVSDYCTYTLDRPLKIAVGYGIREQPKDNMHLVFQKATELMFQEERLLNINSDTSAFGPFLRVLEKKDFFSLDQVTQLQNSILLLAKKVRVPQKKHYPLVLLAHFHNLGKMAISDDIFRKSTSLTEFEWQEIKKHPQVGYNIAKDTPELALIDHLILKHHEWWNGGGYPLGLKGAEIPIECRILAISDAFFAMSSNRPYREALPKDEVLYHLKEGAGSQFDPYLVENFLQIIENEAL